MPTLVLKLTTVFDTTETVDGDKEGTEEGTDDGSEVGTAGGTADGSLEGVSVNGSSPAATVAVLS
jgi:hypothetical protein